MESGSEQTHLLVVDDDAADRAAVGRLLGSMPRYRITEVDSCDLARDTLDGRPEEFDCVLLDIRLPDGDARDLLVWAKTSGIEAPMVILTSRGNEETAVALLKIGAADYLTKNNLTARRLQRAIQTAIRVSLSERKAREAETALRANRQSLSTTLASIADGVITTDESGFITYMNPAAEVLVDTPHSRAIGQPLSEVMSTVASGYRLMTPIPGARSPLDGAKREVVLTTRSARTMIVEHKMSLLLEDDRATPSGEVHTLTDVTDERLTQARTEFLASVAPTLSAARDLNQVLAVSCTAIVSSWVEECAILVTERETGETFRATSRDAAHALLDAPCPGTWKAPIQSASFYGQLVARSPRRVELDGRFMAEYGQRIAGALENAWLFERLRQAVQVRDDFLAVVSHDLRSPLGTLSLIAEGLRDGLPDSKSAGRYASIVERAVMRMDRLIQDLLDAEAIDTGNLSLELVPVAPDELVRETIEMFGSQAAEKGLALRHATDGDLPKVLADRHRMLQVLSNLVANAVKFTPRGSVTVEAKRLPRAVRLAVADTGAGIHPDDLPHLFERFWRGERDASGIGLGLAIARGIVSAHNSELRVISKAGRGTRFEFELYVA